MAWSLTALLSLSCGEAMADMVVLRGSGAAPERHLSGTVLSVTDESVVLQMSDGTRLPLSRDGVLSIHFGETTRPAPPELAPLSAPVPASPASEQSLAALHRNLGGHTLRFPDGHGKVDEKRFITLSRFTGHRSGALYAGLYNFSDKGTFWVHLPEALSAPARLSFTLYGKKNEGQPTERFSARARFIDANGRVIGESPLGFFTQTASPALEWFNHLEGVSGLGGATDIAWQVPAQTRSIELRADAESNPERHLVGYLGNLSLHMAP